MRASLRELFSELEEAIQLTSTLMLDPLESVRPQPSLPVPPPALPPLPDLSQAGFGTSIWSAALDWSREASQAQSAFLVDADGLVIATSGPLEPQQAETLAPRLLSSLEQMELMDQPFGPFQAVSGRLGEQWLTGFLIHLPDNLPLLLGMAGPVVVDAALKLQFEQLLAQAFES